jgi:hypothetical protein
VEKIVAALWAPPGEDRASFGARLVGALPAALTAAGASSIRINIRDAAVEPAAPLVQQWQAPQQDAAVQFWLPSSNALFRSAIDEALAAHSGAFHAWLVTESTIIPNCAHPAVPDTRCAGWSQASFISFRKDMDRHEAIAHWHAHHTKVAIETQANFEYVQNLIVRALTPDAPAYDAFVEECFALAAMTDPAAFFNAVGDPELFARNTARMLESCNAFIDFARIDIIPTSQYNPAG